MIVDITVPFSNFALNLQRNLQTYQSLPANPYTTSIGGDRFTVSARWEAGKGLEHDGATIFKDTPQELRNRRVNLWRKLTAELAEASEPGNLARVDFARLFQYKRRVRRDANGFPQAGLGFELSATADVGARSVQVIDRAGGFQKGELFTLAGELKEVTADAVGPGREITVNFQPALRKVAPVGSHMEVDAPFAVCRITTDSLGFGVTARMDGIDDVPWIGGVRVEMVEFDDFEVVLDRFGVPSGDPLFVHFTHTPARPRNGQTVTLRADAYAPDGAELAYEWASSVAGVEFMEQGDAQPTFQMPNSSVDITLTARKVGDPEISASRTITIQRAAPRLPAAPTNVVATAIDNDISLNWDDADDADSWLVWVSRTAGQFNQPPRPVRRSEAHYLDLQPARYYFRVAAVNDTGQSAAYGTANAVVGGVGVAPLPPVGLGVTPKDTSAYVFWNPSEDAQSWQVRVKPSASTQWGANRPTSSPQLNVTGLTASTKYDFAVRAVNAAGNSDWVQITRTTDDPPLTAPDNPGGLTWDSTEHSLTWAWNKTPRAETHSLRYRRRGTSAWTTVNDIQGLNHTVRDLPSATQYDSELRASNAAGNSPQWVSFGPPRNPIAETVALDLPAPGVPINLAGTASYDTGYITWNLVEDADSYNIRWRLQGTGGYQQQTTRVNRATILLAPRDVGDALRTYEISVQSVRERGNPVGNEPINRLLTSAWSNTLTLNALTRRSKPPAPTAVLLRTLSPSSFVANVPAQPYSKRFEVRERGGSWGNAAVIGVRFRQRHFTQRTPGKTYEVRVRHEFNGQVSDWTTSDPLTLPLQPLERPDPYTGIMATDQGGGRTTFSWTNPTPAPEYTFARLRDLVTAGGAPVQGSERVVASSITSVTYHLTSGKRYRFYLSPHPLGLGRIQSIDYTTPNF